MWSGRRAKLRQRLPRLRQATRRTVRGAPPGHAALGAARALCLALVIGGLSAYFFAQPTALPLDTGQRAAAGIALALLSVLFAAGATLSGGREWRSTWSSMTRVALPLLPLAPLGVYPHSPTFVAVACGMALVSYGVTWSRDAVAGPGARVRGRLLGPFQASVFGFCALVLVMYVFIAAHTDGSFQNDSAYYFGVAKHMAVSGRFESPIVWQFLRRPAHVPTAPFDYWGGLTSLVLVPFLVLFGHTHRVADIVMGSISAVSVMLFAYLVTVQRVVRNRLVAGALVVAFAIAPALHTFRFDTETIPLYHLLLLLALLFAFQKRWAWASLFAGLLYHVRPDALFVTLVVWCWALYEAWLAGRLRRVAAVQIGLVGATLLYGAIAFGLPLGVRDQAVHLKTQLGLYLWGPGRPEVKDLFDKRLQDSYLAARSGSVVSMLGNVVPGGAILLAFIVAAGGIPARIRPRAERRADVAIWLLGVPMAVLIGAASGPMFVAWRTLHPLVPTVLLGAGRAVDSLIDRLRRSRTTPSWARQTGALTLTGICVFALVRPLSVYGLRERARIRSAEVELRRLDPVLHGQVVASDRPWYVIADTKSPAVNIPIDGPRAVEDVLSQYRVSWVILVGRARDLHRSAAVFTRAAHRWTVGPFQLDRRAVGGGVQLIHVTHAPRVAAQQRPHHHSGRSNSPFR